MRYDGRYRSIYVSKGISKEERDVIFEGVMVDWSQGHTAHWYTFGWDYPDIDDILVPARFMGFRFESETDRGHYNTRDDGRMKDIMLVKKPRQVGF